MTHCWNCNQPCRSWTYIDKRKLCLSIQLGELWDTYLKQNQGKVWAQRQCKIVAWWHQVMHYPGDFSSWAASRLVRFCPNWGVTLLHCCFEAIAYSFWLILQTQLITNGNWQVGQTFYVRNAYSGLCWRVPKPFCALNGLAWKRPACMTWSSHPCLCSDRSALEHSQVCVSSPASMCKT